MDARSTHTLGDPDLRIAGLRLWVHNRQFPESEDYWDGNWLNVTAECRSPGTSVRVDGPIVHLGEIQMLIEQLEVLYRSLHGQARLECMEPNLDVSLRALTGGHIEVRISLTPNQLAESHTYTEGLDQTFLPGIIAECKAILGKFPPKSPKR